MNDSDTKKRYNNMIEPFVSIVIVNFNGVHHLFECLNSIEELDYNNYEVVLVDNASHDNSIDFVKNKFSWVRIITLEINHGFAEGSNIGASYAAGEFVVFLNNDTKVDKKWLSELVNVIAKDDSIATCGSKMYFYEGDIINHAGGEITLLGNGFDIGFGQMDSENFNTQRLVGTTCGGSMIIRKKVFDQLGGFDPDYFACFEDVDLCLRAWIYGYKSVYVPTSIVYHKYGATLGTRQSAKRVYVCQRNRLINIFKNFEFPNIVKGICISIPYDFVRFFIFLFQGEVKIALSLIKSYFDVISKFGYILQKRKIIQKNRNISDSKLIENGIITPLTDGIKEFIRLNRLKYN